MKKILLAILFTIISGYAWAQTIPNASPLYNSYSCNSSTTQFPYAFYINSTSDMVVQLTDSGGNITFPTNFTVDTTNVWVNYPLTGTCPTGDTVTLYASTPITQTTSYGQRNPFTATAVGSSFNKLTIISQQLQRQLNSALLLPIGSSPGTFPSSSPGNYIGWNGAGVLANIPSPANAALWTLSGANAQYNLGNVSTTGNVTASASGSSFATNVGIGSANPGQALDVSGTVRATAFMTPSGTSSQFLKANGTLDSSTYITGVSLLPITLSGNNVGIGSVTPGQVLDVQGTVRASSGFLGISPYVKVSNTQTSGSGSGTASTGAWNIAPLNTKDTDTASIGTLNTNVLTLPAGTYKVFIATGLHNTNSGQTRLYNVTGSAVLLNGTNAESTSAVGVSAVSIINGEFTLAASSGVRVEYNVANTGDFGTAQSAGPEVYGTAEFTKIN